MVGWAALSAIYQSVTGHPASFQFAPAGIGWWTDALNLLVLATVFVAPHEWLHGLAIRYYGGKARYGVGVVHFILPYAYATTDHEFSPNQFVVVLLTPLVVVTAVGLPLLLIFEWGWLVVPLAANAAGAVASLRAFGLLQIRQRFIPHAPLSRRGSMGLAGFEPATTRSPIPLQHGARV